MGTRRPVCCPLFRGGAPRGGGGGVSSPPWGGGAGPPLPPRRCSRQGAPMRPERRLPAEFSWIPLVYSPYQCSRKCSELASFKHLSVCPIPGSCEFRRDFVLNLSSLHLSFIMFSRSAQST